MNYDCIIIGAGMAGLTSALKLASSGKKVLVLEKQPVPGGVATSFRRKGFIFESSLHFVDALAKGEEIRDFLDEHGISDRVEFIGLQEFGRVIYPEHDFIVGNDFEGLKELLKNDFPAEHAGIEEFFGDINRFYKHFDNFTGSKLPLWLNMFLLPFLNPMVIKASCLNLEQFITRKIKDKKLRGVISTLWGFIGLPPAELSAFYFLIVLRGCWGRKTAYVKGGFSQMFRAMVDKIREGGSEVRFNTTVKNIITDGNKRVKLVLSDKGEEFRAGSVISNANAIDTLVNLIDVASLRESYAKKLSQLEKSVSAVTVYLGLDVDVSSLGMKNHLLSINSLYDHNLALQNSAAGDYRNCSMAVVSHSLLDAGLAPAGKSAVCIMTLDSYSNWRGLTDEAYQKKKKETASMLVANLEKYLPGLSAHIEVLEVATPLTMARYGSMPEGAIYGFAQNVPQSSINRLSQQTAVGGLFLAGAWTRPGCGIHGCLVSGKDAADLVLRYLK